MAMVSSTSSRRSVSYGSRTITTYSCQICGRTFSLQSQAEEHVRVEHPEIFESAFVCSICKERFVTRGEGESHLKSHHPELSHPYACPRCQVRFSTEQEVRRHMKSSHPEYRQSIDCPACGKRIRALDFHDHLRKKHRELLSALEAENSRREGRSDDGADPLSTATSTRSPVPPSLEPSVRTPPQQDTTANRKGPWWRFWRR